MFLTIRYDNLEKKLTFTVLLWISRWPVGRREFTFFIISYGRNIIRLSADGFLYLNGTWRYSPWHHVTCSVHWCLQIPILKCWKTTTFSFYFIFRVHICDSNFFICLFSFEVSSALTVLSKLLMLMSHTETTEYKLLIL